MYKTSKLVLAALGLVSASQITNSTLPVDHSKYDKYVADMKDLYKRKEAGELAEDSDAFKTMQ